MKRCADEADKCAAFAQAGADLAIRHAWNAGTVCNRAKDILPHGEFMPWLESNAGERGYWTLNRWMKLAKFDLGQILGGGPKGLKDAYIATGILPEPEAKDGPTGHAKSPMPWHPLKFSTKLNEWTKEQALDFIYEFDRAAQFVRALKMEFGV